MQLNREQRERAWLAWQIAALPRYKRFPDLKKFQGRERTVAPRRPQTSDQQWAIFGAIAEAAKVTRKN